MNFKNLFLALLCMISLSVTSVIAETEDNVEDYLTQCNAPAEFLDPEVMAKTMADPAKFMQLIAELNKPATMQAMMQCSVSPEQWANMATNYADPTKWMNSMTPFMNPQTYMNWMAASMNPQTYTPFMAYMNPSFYMHWMTAMMNPAFYMQPMNQMMNSDAYTKSFESFFKFPPVAQNTIN